MTGSAVTPSRIESISVDTSVTLPVRRRWAVRIGISTVSSWSWPIAPWPLACRTPMISQVKFFTRSSSPSGEPRGKSCFLTVSPMMHTALPAASSSSSNCRPAAICQLPAVK